VTVRFWVEADGKVQDVCFLDTAIDDQEMLECLQERFSSVEIAHPGKRLTVVLPMVFVIRSPPGTTPGDPSTCERLRNEDEGP
jgi:hypothetical protein